METDTLVIGAGLAGLMAALSLAPKPVLLRSKGPLAEDGASCWAQGGISAAVGNDDCPANHRRDTVAAAAGIANEDIAALVTDLGPAGIDTLAHLGVTFDRNDRGLDLRKEAAHSHRRVVHANGDATGQEVMRALKLQILASRHITVLEGAEAIDLLTDGHRVFGAMVQHKGEMTRILASAVVLATGGIGQIYSASTNPLSATGDGLAMAARAGAVLQDLEFVQFHPTALDVDVMPRPLATEALRGEGAILVNDLGDPFMAAEHSAADLAPRDIVARGIWKQMAAGRTCFLDTRSSIGHRFEQDFPTVFAHCRNHGIDPRSDLIPIAPAAHYHMGGVATDAQGHTSLAGLWACGEVACTGLHGANRLASNSLLEALVFGPIVADAIKKSKPDCRVPKISKIHEGICGKETASDAAAIAALQGLNYRHIGVSRNRSGLIALLHHLDKLADTQPNASQRLRNIMTCSRLVATAALDREESRGGHYRSDFPDSLASCASPSYLTLDTCQTSTNRPDLPLAS